MLFCALLLVTSVPQLALTYRVAAVHDSEPSQQDVDEKRVTSPSEDDVLPIGQDKAFRDLLDQRNALADQNNKLLDERAPGARFDNGSYYWIEEAPHVPVERCCCPFDTAMKKRYDGHAAFPGCKNLHAFTEGEQREPIWRLKAGSWLHTGKWVCPGTPLIERPWTPRPWHSHGTISDDEYPFSLHHAEGVADLAACARDKAAQAERAHEIDMERKPLQDQIETMDQDISVMEQNYPCTTLAGEIVDSDGIPGFQYIGNGDLTNAHTQQAHQNAAKCADACRESKGGCAGITVYPQTAEGIRNNTYQGRCYLLWGLQTPNIGPKRHRNSADASTYRNCPTRTSKGMCANSNGIHGYEFSHVGTWDGNYERGTPDYIVHNSQTCALACTQNGKCVAFGVNAKKGHCLLYLGGPQPQPIVTSIVKMHKDAIMGAVAYRKCKE